MDIPQDPIEDAEVKAKNENLINEKLEQYGVEIMQIISELRTIKTFASARAKQKSNTNSSSRIEVTEIDLKYLEGIIKGEVPLTEFWYAIRSLHTDVNYMLYHSDEILDNNSREKLNEIYTFLMNLILTSM